MALPPAGWYPDPDGGDVRRWWDGAQWTEERSEIPGTLHMPDNFGVQWDYAIAVLAPPVGLLLGISKIGTNPARAWQVVALSLGAALIWCLLWAVS